MKLTFFQRIRTQILMIWLISLAVIVCALAITLYSASYKLIMDSTTNNAYNIAKSLAASINGDVFKQIQSIEDEATPAYQNMRAELARVREMSGCKFVFTMRKTANGTYAYVVDGSEEQLLSHVGDSADGIPAYDHAWSGQPYKEDRIIDQGEWGLLASSYYPFEDSSGAVVGFVGVDYDAESAYNALRALRLLAIAIAAGGFLVCLVIGILLANHITKPIVATAAFAQALSSGSLNAPINVTAKSEIGYLAKVMDTDMRQAFKNVAAAQTVAEKQSSYQADEVQKVLLNLSRLAQGELYCDMQAAPCDNDTRDLHDIYSEIAQTLRHATNNITTYITDLTTTLDSMASCDLTGFVTTDYQGDFAVLKDYINRIYLNLNKTLAEVSAAAGRLAIGTQHVSAASQDISRGAMDQASAIQELTASITEIAAQTQQNADAAKSANTLTSAAKEAAAAGNVKMQELQGAMAQISASSSDINRVIKVIDDIAFQTNILALNAAVEAARAGIHGKGFAVVAEEVRNLAAKSASAAKETASMIEDSIHRAQTGTSIAQETATSLGSIMDSVEQAAQVISQIALASNEQAIGVEQINKGIEQVSQVMQGNAAISQEAAATAEELDGHANLLSQMVSRFKLRPPEGGPQTQDAYQPPLTTSRTAPRPALQPGNASTFSQRNAFASPSAPPSFIHLSNEEDDFGKY